MALLSGISFKNRIVNLERLGYTLRVLTIQTRFHWVCILSAFFMDEI